MPLHSVSADVGAAFFLLKVDATPPYDIIEQYFGSKTMHCSWDDMPWWQALLTILVIFVSVFLLVGSLSLVADGLNWISGGHPSDEYFDYTHE
jgi:hypothetical protein